MDEQTRRHLYNRMCNDNRHLQHDNAELQKQITDLQAQLAQAKADAAALNGSPLAMIASERRRQREVEGWTEQHDDEHKSGQMTIAAACYAIPNASCAKRLWPWDWKWFKHTEKTEIRRLVVAGALIVAELERLEREAITAAKQ